MQETYTVGDEETKSFLLKVRNYSSVCVHTCVFLCVLASLEMETETGILPFFIL